VKWLRCGRQVSRLLASTVPLACVVGRVLSGRRDDSLTRRVGERRPNVRRHDVQPVGCLTETNPHKTSKKCRRATSVPSTGAFKRTGTSSPPGVPWSTLPRHHLRLLRADIHLAGVPHDQRLAAPSGGCMLTATFAKSAVQVSAREKHLPVIAPESWIT
jgi:hypothetical protein